MEGTKPAEIISGLPPVLFSSACLLSKGSEAEARRLLCCAAEMLLQLAVGIKPGRPSDCEAAVCGSDVFLWLGARQPLLADGFGKLVEFRCRLAVLEMTKSPCRQVLTELLEMATNLTMVLGRAVREGKESTL